MPTTTRIKAATADLNPGETVEFMTSDLFDVMAEGYTVPASASLWRAIRSVGSASGEVVTINAEMAGESKVTVTGTASMSIVLAHAVADRVERRLPHVPRDGGRHGRWWSR